MNENDSCTYSDTQTWIKDVDLIDYTSAGDVEVPPPDKWQPLWDEGYDEDAIKDIRRGILEADYGLVVRYKNWRNIWRSWHPWSIIQKLRNKVKCWLLLWLALPFRKEYKATKH